MTPRRRRTKIKLDPAIRERLFAGRTPGTAVTKEEWEALGYGNDGHASRPFTDDPIGTHPHPKPGAPA